MISQSGRCRPAVGEIERRYDALPPGALGGYLRDDPAARRKGELRSIMALARRQAHLSSERIRRAREAGDIWREAFAILDLLYHRDRHRLARRQAGGPGSGRSTASSLRGAGRAGRRPGSSDRRRCARLEP